MKRGFWVFGLGLVFSALLVLSSLSWAQEGRWTKKADMPIPRLFFSTQSVDGMVYAIGGLRVGATGKLNTLWAKIKQERGVEIDERQ